MKIDDEVEACREVQGWFFSARRNIQKQAEEKAREENNVEMEIEQMNQEDEREDYFSGKHTL